MPKTSVVQQLEVRKVVLPVAVLFLRWWLEAVSSREKSRLAETECRHVAEEGRSVISNSRTSDGLGVDPQSACERNVPDQNLGESQSG